MNNKKVIFIYSSDRLYMLWIMHILRKSLQEFHVNVKDYNEYSETFETDHCIVRFFWTAHSLDHLKANNLKADEIFNFPSQSYDEFRINGHEKPWEDSALEYILKIENEAGAV